MADYLPYAVLFVGLSILLYFYLKRPRDYTGDSKEKRSANHKIQDPHGWALRLIHTNGHNTDGSSRPSLIEMMHLKDEVTLHYNLDEQCYEVQNRRGQTLGCLPHNSTDRVRMYQAAGRIGRISIKDKSDAGTNPKLVLEIEVKP